MCDQGRGALIRMGGAPLVQNRSLPFIRPPPLSCHPNVKIGGALWRYSTVYVIRTRDRELRTIGPARVHATFASPRFSPQCWRLHPIPPTRASSASFRVSQAGPITFLLSSRPLVLIIVTFLNIVPYMWRHSL